MAGAEEDRRGEHERGANRGDGVGTDPVRDQPVDQRPEYGEKRPLERLKRLHPSRPAARDPISVSLFTFGTGPRITAGTGRGKCAKGPIPGRGGPRPPGARTAARCARPDGQDRVDRGPPIQRLAKPRLGPRAGRNGRRSTRTRRGAPPGWRPAAERRGRRVVGRPIGDPEADPLQAGCRRTSRRPAGGE